MNNSYNTILQLTSPQVNSIDRARSSRALNDFAFEFGWQPSDLLTVPSLDDLATHHLVVEHGLENTAVISFLHGSRRFSDLVFDERKRLLSISYNNLVDWHIQVQSDEIAFVYNRIDPPEVVEKYNFSYENIDKLRYESFEKIVGRKPSPNLPALDEALVQTISFWKRNLSAEMHYAVSTEALSALFNAIIFARAVEDHLRLNRSQNGSHSPYALVDTWFRKPDESIGRIIASTLAELLSSTPPTYLLDPLTLSVFGQLHPQVTRELLNDFYRIKYARYYEYDFSIMSKHALSRIYEHYVSILRPEQSPQLALFPSLPKEERERTFGSIYTPEYIARFFARYLREQMPPISFRRMRTIDPACGSGIFLRTLLELQCDPIQYGFTTDLISAAFRNVFGFDVDQNAAQSARLSLALLHLVLAGSLPASLNIFSEETIDYFEQHSEHREVYDAVIANPPFVAWENLSDVMKQRLEGYLGKYAMGRPDIYLAFLKLGLEMLKPGGFGLFVLPHSFLLGKSAQMLRTLIVNDAWIRCLADLSSIRVFENTGSYVILLIIQKKSQVDSKPPAATIVNCQEFVGHALQSAVEGRYVNTEFYSVYEVEQDVFSSPEWVIVPSAEAAIKRKLELLPRIDRFLHVRQGFISGADDIFIVNKESIPTGEERIFIPYLPDRDMEMYTIPAVTSRYFFYPYSNGRRLEEEELKKEFPKTWKYLLSNKDKLSSRSPVKRGQLEWWRPVRPRDPERLLRPKILTPHLVLVPRFSFDSVGQYGVSHSPILFPKTTGAEEDLLRYFTAVLNSTAAFWYISLHSHTYGKSYVRLEVATLKNLPVPDPTSIPLTTMKHLLGLVEKRLTVAFPQSIEVEREIDQSVAELYNLNQEERLYLGLV